MITEPISFKEAESMIDGRMDQATAMKYKDILAGWSQDARQRAFFSARVADATLLSEIHRRVSAVVNGSMTSKQAVRLLRESLSGPNADALAALGFAPKSEARGMAELASVPRLRLIIEQNARMAQECGHYQQWEAVKDYYPIGVWHCGYAEVHRQEHLERDGKAYEFDHPIWTQSPPGGEFNCHCWRENMTRDGATAKGLVPEPNTSFFQPSSLGFDPSQPFDASSVVPGKSVLPEFVQKAKDSECPDDLLVDMKEIEDKNGMPLELAMKKAAIDTDAIGDYITDDIREKYAEYTKKRDVAKEQYLQYKNEYERYIKKYKRDNKRSEFRPDTELQEKLNNAIDGATLNANIYHQNVDLLQKQADDFTDLFAIDPKDRGKINISGVVPQEFMTRLEKAKDFLEKHIAAYYLKDTYAIKRYNGKRSFYREAEKSINMGKDARVKTFVHELCHGIEDSNPYVKKRCLEFLEHRCATEASVSLAILCPKQGYSVDEKTRKDNFFNPYCGKDYFGTDGKRNSTELLSMGAERLYYDPIGFRKQDQEYFNFVVDLLRGNI